MRIQHVMQWHDLKIEFESSVISYGNQTKKWKYVQDLEFESSVISYGNQTYFRKIKRAFRV